MNISIFVSPSSTWKPPVAPPICPATSATPKQPSWEDFAAAEDWASALVGYLRAKPRQIAGYWEAINALVRESGQPTRWQVRSATLDVLEAAKALRQQRRIMRFRRRQLALIESLPVIPLEQVPRRNPAWPVR